MTQESGSQTKEKSPLSWVIGGTVVVIVIGALYFATRSDEKNGEGAMMAEEEVGEVMAPKPETALPVATDDVMMESEPVDEAMMVKVGTYEAYDPSKLAMAKDGKVVLFFRASWCPTCRALDSDIKGNLSAIPVGTIILDVDYDKYADLKKRYGVTTQHTLVQVDADGKELGKWVGSADLSELVNHVK